MTTHPDIVAVLAGESEGCVVCGDCLTVMRNMPAGCVDAVVTDWPYSSGTRREGQKGVRKSMNREVEDAAWFELDSLTTHGFAWLARSVAWEGCRVVMDGSHALFFIDWRMYPTAWAAIETAGWRIASVVVWDKTIFGMGTCFRNQHEFILHATRGIGREPNRRDVGNVIRCAPVRNGMHPTEKPGPLMKTLCDVVSRAGNLILDPFCGSGTTCVAAKRLGRRWIGIEIDERYCEIARNRIRNTERPLFPMETT